VQEIFYFPCYEPITGDLYGLTVAAGEKQQKKLYALWGQSNDNGKTFVCIEVLSWVRCGEISSDKAHRWLWGHRRPTSGVIQW
jgi:hypothetical protein